MPEKNILIVDDEASILNALKRGLHKHGFSCFFAQSGQEALSIIASQDIHVILSDLGMPKMNGIALLKRVKETHPDIVRLILSGQSDAGTVLEAVNNGHILRYITKPWNDDELLISLHQAFELFMLKREKRELLEKLQAYNLNLEKKVSEKTKELLDIQSVAEIGKHASQIVHNLNNPLNAIQGALQLIEILLSKEAPDLEKARKYIGLSRKGVKDMGQIISSILINARDKNSFTAEQVDLNQVIIGCLTLFELDVDFKKNILQQIDLEPDLPQIKGNRIQLKQIFDNLIRNAVDAMEDAPKREMSVKTRSTPDGIRIEIGDTGCGIPADILDKIFLPDFTTKPVGKGTGLGLASVKTMVEGYHGSIDVRSEPDKGTRFTIRLPMN